MIPITAKEPITIRVYGFGIIFFKITFNSFIAIQKTMLTNAHATEKSPTFKSEMDVIAGISGSEKRRGAISKKLATKKAVIAVTRQGKSAA